MSTVVSYENEPSCEAEYYLDQTTGQRNTETIPISQPKAKKHISQRNSDLYDSLSLDSTDAQERRDSSSSNTEEPAKKVKPNADRLLGNYMLKTFIVCVGVALICTACTALGYYIGVQQKNGEGKLYHDVTIFSMKVFSLTPF